MSKEFEEWYNKHWHSPAAQMNDEFDNIKAAFTAGRALGRRDMKGETVKVASVVCDEENYYTKADIKRAIEAIPEEG